MKRIALFFLLVMSMNSYGGFLVDEGFEDSPYVPQENRITPAAHTSLQKRLEVGGRIKHEGRKPAIFGKPVSFRDTTLSLLVLDIVPGYFQVFASDDVNMDVKIKGGKYENWVSALAAALQQTDYVVTIDWDKREVTFSGASQGESLSQKIWHVSLKDGLLSRVLSRWCKESDGECVKFINQSSFDLEIEGEMTISGDFYSAVEKLMASVYAQLGPVFRWKISSNKILVLSDDPSVTTSVQ